jgi:hypothetical protein
MGHEHGGIRSWVKTVCDHPSHQPASVVLTMTHCVLLPIFCGAKSCKVVIIQLGDAGGNVAAIDNDFIDTMIARVAIVSSAHTR